MLKINKLSVIFSIIMCIMLAFAAPCQAKNYGKTLSKSQRESLCTQLKNQTKAEMAKSNSLGGGIIPDNVLTSIYSTTKKISDSTATLLVLGNSLICHAVHAGRQKFKFIGIELFSYPDFSVWLCGIIIYCVGFMMTLSISFYVADIAFKLGFAVIMLPIAISLWPFPPTKDKLSAIISIILNNAAIFIFLGITVSYALNLIGHATTMDIPFDSPTVEASVKKMAGEAKGLEKLFVLINESATDPIAATFTIFSSFFVIMMFALVYGFKLIGSAVPDYANKFFPDKGTGGGSPIHDTMTQGVDFVKKHTVDRAVSYASDVVKTQAGRLTKGLGNAMAGNHVRGSTRQSVGQFCNNLVGNTKKLATSIVIGAPTRLILGKKASHEIMDKVHGRIDDKTNKRNQKIDNWADNKREEQEKEKKAKTIREMSHSPIRKAIRKPFRAIKHFIGEVLAKTGDQMQKNGK